MKVLVIDGAGVVRIVTVRDFAENLGDLEEIIADINTERRRQNHRNHPENTCSRNGEE